MKVLAFIFGLLLLQSCNTSYDLQIINAKIFDTKTGIILDNRKILINADTIAAVVNGNKSVKARKSIDAQGKLVTPGIIDAHIHPMHFFGDYDAAPLYLAADSLDYFRKRFSDDYLPYGVTAVMIMGQPESWLKPILNWSAHPSPDYTDIYTTGGALISIEERQPYIGHITVESPLAARQKVLDYYKMGIRHLKLYWRLRPPEFDSAYKTADSLGMRVYGHIDNDIMNMNTSMQIGLKNYEHIFTITYSLPLSDTDGTHFAEWMDKFYGKDKWQSLPFFESRMNEVRWSIDNQSKAIDSLIENLLKNNATFSTTIHLFAEQFGLAYFSNIKNISDSGLNKERMKRNADNFKAFMTLVKKIYDKGIKIRLGTDCPNGGKAALSEQLILAEYGFSVPAIIQISTINGATALGMEAKYGLVEEGKKADLIIYDKSPFDDYKNFRSNRTIIKDGAIYKTVIGSNAGQ
ncbi:MAG: amidohydrolase family protein [Saprospiraceae bacterium]